MREQCGLQCGPVFHGEGLGRCREGGAGRATSYWLLEENERDKEEEAGEASAGEEMQKDEKEKIEQSDQDNRCDRKGGVSCCHLDA